MRVALRKWLLAIMSTTLLVVCCYFFIKPRYLDVVAVDINSEDFSNDIEGIFELIANYADAHHISAISASIISKGKVYYYSNGTISKKDIAPVDEHSYFQIASTSKMLTGIICNSLILEGKINTDHSIASFFKDELSNTAYERYDSISLKKLLHHRSGLGRSMFAKDELAILDALENVPLEFKTDAYYQYSNYGYALLTLILEKVTGKSYSELLQEYIVIPYGLLNMTAERKFVPKEKLVIPYWKHFRFVEGEIYDFGKQVGASGVFTTVESLSTLMLHQLKAYSVEDSIRHYPALNLTQSKDTTFSKHHFYGYGLFEFNSTVKGIEDLRHQNFEHSGDADGYASAYDFYPLYNSGVVMLTSSGGKWFQELSRKIDDKMILMNYPIQTY